MKINRNNYNKYFLDYWEDNLPEDQKSILFKFLEENQDLKDEFHAFEPITLEKDIKLQYPDKQQLKKKVISISEFEEKCIAFHEGDINSNDRKELLALINNNETLQYVFKSYSNLNLLKDNTITFDSKDLLIKTIPFYIEYKTQLYKGLAAAALIIILFGSYFLLTIQENKIHLNNDQLSVNVIPAKEFVIHLKNHPENKQSSIELRNTLSPNSFARTVYKDITIKQLPFRQTMALELNRYKNDELAFDRIQYLDDQILVYDLPDLENLERKRSLFGRIAGNVGRKIKNLFSPAEELFETEDSKLFWNIAGTGVKGYNLLTNNSYELVRYMDETGKTKSVKLIDNDEASLYLEE